MVDKEALIVATFNIREATDQIKKECDNIDKAVLKNK